MIEYILYWLFGCGQDLTFAIAPFVLGALLASGVSAATSAGSMLYGSVQNNRLSRAQKQQNAFNAAEAAKQRSWEEMMFGKEVDLANTATQRQVKDMISAGVNPALLYGQGAGSGAPVVSSGSGSTASGSYTPDKMITPNLGQQLMDIQRTKAEIDNINADTALKNSEREGKDIQNIYAPDYWRNQIDMMDASRGKIIAETDKCLQELATEEYRTAIASNELDKSWFESNIKMYEMFMTKLDYQTKDEILDLQLKAMRLANDKTSAEIDLIYEQIGEIVQRKILEYYQAGYFKQLGIKEEAFAEFFGSPEGKGTIKTTAEGQAKEAKVKGKYAGVAFWFDAIGGFVKDVGVGVGAATAVKNFKTKLDDRNMFIPGSSNSGIILN